MTSAQRSAVDYMRKAAREAMREQIAFAEIPCPTWRARERAEHLMARLAAADLEPSRDKVGNVIAVRPGTARRKRPTLIIDAHLDSVFYDVAQIKVRRDGGRYHAPGICDDAVGVANLILLAHTLAKFKVQTAGDVIFVGSVGEEGEGLLRGMRHFWKKQSFRDPWFISIDGPGSRITRKALASWSPKIVVKGPGGHSYAHFGRPNPVQMLSRFVSKLATLEVNPENHGVYNATVISGGTAVNVIPHEARLTVNLRSSNPEDLAGMRRKAKRFLREARAEELEWATRDSWLDVKYSALVRPPGETAEDHPLVRTVAGCLEAEGIEADYNVGSTNANMPMSLGVPAINIGAGGRGANAHALDEWYENTGRGKALAALAKIVLKIVG